DLVPCRVRDSCPLVLACQRLPVFLIEEDLPICFDLFLRPALSSRSAAPGFQLRLTKTFLRLLAEHARFRLQSLEVARRHLHHAYPLPALGSMISACFSMSSGMCAERPPIGLCILHSVIDSASSMRSCPLSSMSRQYVVTFSPLTITVENTHRSH